MGEMSFCSSSSDKRFAVDLYSGTELGIQLMSGFSGALRCSRVVVISSLLVLTTIMCTMPLVSIDNDFIFTSPDHPSFA